MPRITLSAGVSVHVQDMFACTASDAISSREGLKGVFKQSLSVQVCMQLPIQQSGICNAIAFWFELDLDEQTQLSTSPYCEKVLLHSIGHSRYFASLQIQRLHIIMLKHAADHCAFLSPSAVYLHVRCFLLDHRPPDYPDESPQPLF